MINDFYIIFSWWLLLFFLGVIALPLTWYFFKKFFDAGYPFSKIISILLVSYFVWLAGSLRILPFGTLSIWFFIFLLGVGNLFLARKYKKEFLEKIKASQKILIFEEALFFLALATWAFIRGFQPNIEGLEKFMDFGFINSILRSRFFPPLDMWMAGKTINYYYFGHFVTAFLTKLSGISSAVTYNLMVATLFAFCLTLSFSFTSNIIYSSFGFAKKKVNWKLIFTGSLLSAILLTLGAHLHPLYWFVTHRGFTGYWYPDATRFIVEKFGALDNTIHEFPIYSSVVSDLHGHFLNIPFVLLFLALLFSFLISFDKKKNYSLFTIHYSLLLALTLAVMYMTNSWDFPIYFVLLGLTLFGFLFYEAPRAKPVVSSQPASQQSCSLSARNKNSSRESTHPRVKLVVFCFADQKKKFFQALRKSFFPLFVIFLLALFFSLPFTINFSPMAEGIGLVNARSPFWQLLVLWGYQWIIGLSFLIFAFRQKKLLLSDILVLALIFWATILIVVPEALYVKDIYIASYHRANTMFKLVYQSFMMYALCSGYIVIRILTSIKRKTLKILVFAFYLLLITFPIIYPYFAVRSYYGNLKTYYGLEKGLSFLKASSLDDYQAVLWASQNISGQPVVLEAAGDSYTQYNRVSALTGLPTVEGWLVHEWLWRGSFDEPGKRASEVKTIYETMDINLAKSLLEKYQVKYVFVGEKEREKYQVFENKFKNLGEIVFTQGNTRIYLLFPKDSQ